MLHSNEAASISPAAEDADGLYLHELLRPAARRWRSVLAIAIASGALGLGGSFLITPLYESRTLFIPPQQQSGGSSALASLGGLAALAGIGGGGKSPIDQYVSLMQSETAMNRIIDKFDLMKVYDVDLREK